MGGKEAKERRRLQRLEVQKGPSNNTNHEQWTPQQKADAALARGDKPSTIYPDNRRGKPGDLRAFQNRQRKPDAPLKAASKNSTKFAKPAPGRKPFPKKGAPSVKAAPAKKEKKFQKPKHLKRKLEHVDENDEIREKLLHELRILEERKKALLTTVTSGNVKKPPNQTWTRTRMEGVAKISKTITAKIPQPQEKNDRTTFLKSNMNSDAKSISKLALISTQTQDIISSIVQDSRGKALDTPKAKLDIETEHEHPIEADLVDEVSGEVRMAHVVTNVKKADKTITTKSLGSVIFKKTTVSYEDSDSDSDSDAALEAPTKRQRGRGRKRPDTEEEVKAKGEAEMKEHPSKARIVVVAVEKPEREVPKSDPTKKTTKADDKRRCVGRKPVTDYTVGERVAGKVVYVKPFGVFIDIGCHSDAFCHISRLQDSFIDSSEEVVKEGNEVSARVVEIDRKQKRVTVSLQSDARMEDEMASVLARKARDEKRMNSKKMKKKKNGAFETKEHFKTETPIESAQEATNNLVDIDGTFLKEESQMTPADVKRAYKLQRRAQRRAQKEETGISA